MLSWFRALRPVAKVLVVLALLLFVSLQYHLWLGEGGVLHVRELQGMVAMQKDENTRLVERNRQLMAEVKDLKNGLEAIEEHARSDLGLVKKDETFYTVVGEQQITRETHAQQAPK